LDFEKNGPGRQAHRCGRHDHFPLAFSAVALFVAIRDLLSHKGQGIEEDLPVCSDCLREQSGFELEVPNLEQPDDSRMF
jgi:hypothetical protein